MVRDRQHSDPILELFRIAQVVYWFVGHFLVVLLC